jgi:glucosamine-6-phosphate deaminase
MSIIQIRQFKTVVASDEKSMGKASGGELVDLLEEFTVKKEVPVFLNLAAAPSQDASYAHVKQKQQRDRVDWSKVWVGHLDDYVDLPRFHPNTFEMYLREHITGRVPIPEEQVYYIKELQKYMKAAGRDSPDQLAREYGKIMKNSISAVRSQGGVYIAHIGYGVNGHMAFNEPHVNKRTKRFVIPVEIDEDSVKQQFNDYKNHPNPKARYRTLADVPRNAISVSMSGILDADYIICVVPGKHKSKAVKGAIDGPLTAGLPASMSRLANNFSLYLTEESASRLVNRPMPTY